MLFLVPFLYSILEVHAQMADIDRLQHDLSRFLAVSRSNVSEKSLARLAIRNAFDGAGLQSFVQSFTSEDAETDDLGSNIISIQPGPDYGKDTDRIVVLCANYDTKENNPGLDDNGSGVAAVLETARAMATLDSLYKRAFTIIYAIVDMKHQSFSGSHAFVEDILLPSIARSNSTVSGVLVLDGVLHFDPFPSSQGTPEDFEEVFPSAAREIHEHNHMGDYIQIIGRTGRDDVVAQSFASAFTRATSMLVPDWSFRPWLLPLPLPIDDVTSMMGMYRLHPYLFADHSSFYFHSNQFLDLPTVYITDTLNYRGVKQYCSYCDGLYMLTEQNTRFLTLITDTVIRTVIHLSGSEARSILDDLQWSNY